MFHPILPFGDFDAPGIFGLPSARVLIDRGITHFNILQAPSARELAQWTNRVQEDRTKSPLGDPGHVLHRSAALVQRQPRHVAARRAVLAVARDARLRRPGRPRPGGAVRRHRPPRVPRGRHPHRPAPAGRHRHRTALVAGQHHLRLERRSRRPPRRRLRARPAGRRDRPGVGVGDGEALPRRRPAEGRRGPALLLRPRAGLPGRHVRVPPRAVQEAHRRRRLADDAVLRHAGRHRVRRGRLQLQQGDPDRHPARPARLRRHHLHRLGHRLPPVLGRRRPHRGRADDQVHRRRRRPVRRRDRTRPARPAGQGRRTSPRPGSTSPSAGCCARSSGSACSTTPSSTSMRRTALVGSAEARSAGIEAQAHAQTLLKNERRRRPTSAEHRHSGSTPRASTRRCCARWAHRRRDPRRGRRRRAATRRAVGDTRQPGRAGELLPRRIARLPRRRARAHPRDRRDRSDGRRRLPRPAGDRRAVPRRRRVADRQLRIAATKRS